MAFNRPGLIVLASLLVSLFAGENSAFAASKKVQLSCEGAFAPAVSLTAALTVQAESFDYIRQISGRTDFNDNDLGQMSKLSQLLGAKPSALYARATEVLRLSDSEMALTVNNTEVIRAAALSMHSSIDQLRTNLGTLIVMLKPIGAGGRRLAVPNRVQLRLASLSLLTGESPGDVAYRFNDNFKAALTQPPMSAEDMIFAKSPIDIALSLTIAESTIANSNAAMVVAE